MRRFLTGALLWLAVYAARIVLYGTLVLIAYMYAWELIGLAVVILAAFCEDRIEKAIEARRDE